MRSDQAVTILYLMLLGSARLGACLTLSPLLSARALPAFVRLAIYVGLSMPIIGGNFDPSRLAALSGWGMIGLLVKEIIVGSLLGVPAAALWWGLEGAGSAIDEQRAFGALRGEYSLLGDNTSLSGVIFEFTFTVFFVTGGGLILLAGLIYKSFASWGLWDPFPFGAPNLWEVALSASTILTESLGLIAATPMISIVLIEVAVLMVSRVAPQLASDFLTMPAKLFVSVAFAMLTFLYVLKNQDLTRLFPTAPPRLETIQPDNRGAKP